MTGQDGKDNNIKNVNGATIIVSLTLIIIIVFMVGFVFLGMGDKSSKKLEQDKTNSVQEEEKLSNTYPISSNSLEDFDLAFLQFEKEEKNVVYSPLSIKYALAMLSAGANGTTKSQIDNIIGKYHVNKYYNSTNMSFANAIFVKNTYKDLIKQNYINSLKNNYSAEVVYDSFANPDAINNWISDKTLHLIDKLVEDVTENNFVLVNALAIDMEWKNLLQAASGIPNSKVGYFEVEYKHENFKTDIQPLMEGSAYPSVKFGSNSKNTKAVEIGAVLNNYDIVNDLGRENIRSEIDKEYREWLVENDISKTEEEIKDYVNQFIEDLDSNYKNVSVSSDFSIYTDENVKVFAKDLKEYDGVTLEYIGIMPKQDSLDHFIKNNDASSIRNLLKNLKELKLENFTPGKVTHITGNIPLFNFDYELDLEKDLKQMGITNIFDSTKADLSNLISVDGEYMEVKHKANIEFSNEGIKAAAVVVGGGLGNASWGFEHLYEVPVEKIDITFDQPYMFMIRNKATGEVWFAGKVYEPTENNQ